jgi:hypothetical protein
MRKQKLSRPFLDGRKTHERNALLRCWLQAGAEGTKVIDGVPPSLQQLAKDLSAHFNIRMISARAVRSYVKEAQRAAEGAILLIRQRGRLPADKTDSEFVGPKRLRGRPRKAPEEFNNPVPADIQQATVKKLRKVTAASRQADLQARLAAEAMQLTGLNQNGLHEAFFGKADWDRFLGRRSGYFYRLKKLKAKLASDTSALRPDDDIYHSLRLHQVVLQISDDLWCVFLFGYEPRTHFLNAACYVAHLDGAVTSKKALSGRPVTRLHPTWRCTLAAGEEQIKLHLPPDAIWTFLIDTRARMAVLVDAVWLSSSLAPQAELIRQLYDFAPDGSFREMSHLHEVFVSADAGKGVRVTKLCNMLGSLLKEHNHKIAYPRLHEYQARVDLLIQKEFHIRTLPSGRQIFRRREIGVVIGDISQAIADRERAIALVEYRNYVAERPHKEFRLSLVPIHLGCDVR